MSFSALVTRLSSGNTGTLRRRNLQYYINIHDINIHNNIMLYKQVDIYFGSKRTRDEECIPEKQKRWTIKSGTI